MKYLLMRGKMYEFDDITLFVGSDMILISIFSLSSNGYYSIYQLEGSVELLPRLLRDVKHRLWITFLHNKKPLPVIVVGRKNLGDKNDQKKHSWCKTETVTCQSTYICTQAYVLYLLMFWLPYIALGQSLFKRITCCMIRSQSSWNERKFHVNSFDLSDLSSYRLTFISYCHLNTKRCLISFKNYLLSAGDFLICFATLRIQQNFIWVAS